MKHAKHLSVILCLVAVTLGLSACMATEGKAAKLNEAVFYFNEGVRWGRIQDVIARLDPAAEAHFLEMHKEFGSNIKVTGYDLTSSNLDLENNTADIGIKITWYRNDEMVVYETLLIQHWTEKKNHWVMTGEEFVQGEMF